MAEHTFNLLRKLVDETRCKPGWKFRLIDQDERLYLGGEAHHLTLVIEVPGLDAFHPEGLFTVLHYHPVPYATFNEKSWRRWIFDQCLRTETHELAEWLRFGNGDDEIRPFLPTHGPGEDPYALREYRHEDDAFTMQNGSLRRGVGPNGIR